MRSAAAAVRRHGLGEERFAFGHRESGVFAGPAGNNYTGHAAFQYEVDISREARFVDRSIRFTRS